MATKVRKQIYIEPEQEVLLKQLTRQTGKSEAELIREALEQYLQEQHTARRRQEAWRNIEAFIEQRRQLGIVPGERNWRREDLYDR